jgi:hypothetical protein
MSLQRGSYGIEFDDRQGFPYQKLWWLAGLVPVAALCALFLRGCPRDAAPSALDEDPALAARFDAPEVQAQREKPSFLRHFFRGWSAAPAAATAAAAQGAAPADSSGWKSSAATKAPPGAQGLAPEVKRQLDQAAACVAADDLVGARKLYRRVLVLKDAESVRPFIEKRLGALNTTLAFADRPMPEKVKHRIAEGDFVSKLAKRYGCTQEYILRANGIDKPEQLRVGREIWALDHPVFELTIFKREGCAVLTLNGQYFKRYAAGVGRPEESPSGTYAVRSRVKKPAYRSAQHGEVPFGNPKNILGTYWISLDATGETTQTTGFGLHGTWNEASLGRASDEGRIRFRNEDIEELAALLPAGALVNVTE